MKGRKSHLIVDAGGTPTVMTVHTADIQDRDGAPDLIAELLETVPTVCTRCAHGVQAVRRRWPPGSEAAGAAWGDGVAGRDRDRRKTGGCQRVHGSLPPVGRGADLRLDGPVPPPVEGLRAPLREPAGIRGEASRATGPGVSEARTNAGRPPVPAQAGGEGVSSMKDNGLIISVTYDSNSYGRSAHRFRCLSRAGGKRRGIPAGRPVATPRRPFPP